MPANWATIRHKISFGFNGIIITALFFYLPAVSFVQPQTKPQPPQQPAQPARAQNNLNPQARAGLERALQLLESNQLDEAEKAARLAVASAPRSAVTHNLLGVRLEKVLTKNPTHTQAHYQLFLAYSRLKQTDKAQVELAEFRRLEALEKQVKQERILDEKIRTQQMLGQPQQ